MNPEQPQPQNITPNPSLTNSGPAPAAKKRRLKGDGWKSILSTITILVVAPLFALVLISFVFQSYEVDGPSMETTLQNGDRLVVVKTGKTWANLTGKKFIPKRGEIVIFNKSGIEGVATEKRQLIKRVIGIPGDRVVIKSQKITIYNDENPNGFNPDEGTEYIKDASVSSGNVDLTIPAGEIFVAGDNRTNSLDSRAFGTIKSDEIVGTLALRIFPVNKITSY